ncbi:PspC domain-containing protein [Nocardioides zhouii]|nr:PspC domain-containing protein [Nocardioides zhouii]
MDNASPTTTGQNPTPPPPPSGEQPTTGPRVTRDEMKDLGRLRRSVTDRHIAGVAGGIARHLDIDAIIVRVALVVAVFFGGAGFLLYIGAWLLVPEEGTDDEPLGLDRRSRSLAVAGVGVIALLCAIGDWAGAFWFPWQLAIVAAIVVLFLHRKERRSGRRTGYGYTEPTTETTTETSYASPAEPQHWETYAREPRPRNPRKRGPILFFFTLALIALAEGVLGVVDLAGVDVADGAYPALALGVTAVMLVVGSFWGRAGGLIALGLVAALATAGSVVGSSIGDERRGYSPTTAGDVQESYEFGAGRFTLDLSDVSDIEALDGRDISIDGVGGEVEVIVPDGMDVDVRAQVVGGDIRLFDQRADGFDRTLTAFRDAGDGVPDMSITIDLVGGEITVREAA